MSQQTEYRPIVAIFWMLLTGMCFVAVTALVKFMGTHIPAAEAAFLRYALGLVLLAPMVAPLLRSRIDARMHGLFALRGALHSIGVVCWFYSMGRIPLAEVTALNYLSPVYVTVGAALFLGEPLALRRIMAVAAALVGVVIILRPGFRTIEPGHMTMFVTGLSFGGSYLIAKVLADRTNAAVVVAMLSIWVTIGLAPLAIWHWVTPSLRELAILFFVAAFATAGHYSMTRALGAAPVSVTQPVTFLQLIWASLLGAVVFGEALDRWVLAGGGLILGAVSYISWREARHKRARGMTPAVPETKL